MASNTGRSMREHLQQSLKPIKEKTGLWWMRFWHWPGLLCECHDELRQLDVDLGGVRESLRNEQVHSEMLERLANESREIAAASMQRMSAEKSLYDNLSEELGNAKVQVQKASETIAGLETRISRSELETERIKAELSKTQADLARSQFEQAREKDEHAQTRTIVRLLREWIHTTHRVDIPARNGTIRNILAGMKRLGIIAMLLLPFCLFAQFPPPFFRNAWTTNVPPNAVYGNDNLSVTNIGGGTNWLFHSVRPQTIARLIDVTNIASGIGGLSTNANQFLGVPLSIKSGAFQTNFNGWSNGTNNGNFYTEDHFPLSDNSFALGTAGSAWSGINTYGVSLQEIGGAGNDTVSLISGGPIGASYTLRFPTAQGVNGDVLTNDGTGLLNWWNAGSAIISATNSASVTNWINFRQPANAVLTNLSNNPYTGYTNEVFGGTNISVRTAGGTNFIDTTGHLNNWAQIPTGAMANVVSTDFLTNWANSISNLAQTKQGGTASLTNLSGNPNVATNILGAGTVTVTSNNLGEWTISGSAGSGGSVFTQGVSVVTAATNLNFVNGSNIAINAVNASGNVTLTFHSPTDFTNIYYVNKDSNLSQIMTNAPNNSVILIGQGDWTNSTSYFSSNRNLGMFHLLNKTNITIQGVGRATLKTVTEGDILVLSNCSYVKVLNLNFEGVKITNIVGTAPWYATAIAACKEVEVAYCSYRNIGNHAISEYLEQPEEFQSTNIYVHDDLFFFVGSWFNNSLGYDGTSVQPGSFWKVYRNRFYECTAPIELFGIPGADKVVQNDISDNYLENPVKWGISDAGNTNNHDHVISRNRIVFNNATRIISSNALSSANAMNIHVPRGYKIEDNVITGPPSVGIFFGSQSTFPVINNSIERNYISNSQDGIIIGEQAADTGKHSGNKVAGNKISTMSNSGITIAGSDTWVTDNDLENCALSFQAAILVGTAGSYVATNILILNNRIRTSPSVTPAGPAIQIDVGAVNCRQFNNDITGNHPVRIVDNGDMPQPSLYVEMVTGIKTNPFVIYNTNRSPVFSVDSRGFLMITNSLTNRVAAPTNTIAFGAENFGGFNLPNWTDHNGLQAALQPFFAHEHIYWLSTYNGTQIGGQGVAPVTNVGTTVSHPLPVESQPHAIQLASVATSNGCATAFSAVDLANAGAHDGSSKIGGYFFSATWYSTNLISGVVGGGAPRHFVGLTTRAQADYTNMVVTTNATGQYVGLYADPHQSLNMYISARDSVAEFRTNTGINFVATNVYKFYMFNAPTSRFVGWRLDDAYAGLSASGWFSNNVPTNFMKFGIATKNGTNRANDVRFSRMYLQAPLSPPR